MNFSKTFTNTLLAASATLWLSGCMTIMPMMAPTVEAEKNISSYFPFEPKFVTVNGSKMHYVETGSGTPVVFIHGNPTSSYLWRNVLPIVAKGNRAIALDLIGMGKSDKPNIPYTLDDQIRYFDGFMTAMNLKEAILVVHDWGGAIGIDYAMRHQDQVKGLVMMETLIRPMKWSEWGFAQKYMFKRLRDAEDGYDLIVKENIFVDKFLPMMAGRKLTDAEMSIYRAPYLKEVDRTPVRNFPLEIPIDGEPKRTHTRIQANYVALQQSQIPLLLLRGKPGALMESDEYVESFKRDLPRMRVQDIGPGLHYLQEAQPTRIGDVSAKWIDEIKRGMKQ